MPPLDMAVIYAGLGEREQALSWLQRAHEEHAAYFPAINVDPVFDGLRSDAGFQNLLRRIGLPPPAVANGAQGKSALPSSPYN